MSKADRFFGQYNKNKVCGPDLYEEFNKLIKGHKGCEGIGQLLILRHFDKTKRAPGYDPLFGGSTLDPWDDSEKYQWEEKYVLGHFTQTYGRALSSANQAGERAMIYLMAEADVKSGDRLYRIKTNNDGSAYYPVQRIEKWNILEVEDRRQEHSKVAFYICVCEFACPEWRINEKSGNNNV